MNVGKKGSPWRLAAICLAALAGHGAVQADVQADEPVACTQAAGPGCYRAFQAAPGGGEMHYYASMIPGAGPTRAVIVVHGHPRDANRSFDATLAAVKNAGRQADTLVIAPVFQVAATQSAKCRRPDTPAPESGDLLWTCSSWLAGAPANDAAGTTSFAAMDALVAEISARWPGLASITVAGFSAGAQMVQHYIGFARPPVPGPALRYVVSDPGSWLYFDPVRAAGSTPAETCPGYDRWKYGIGGLPANLGRNAAEARAQYAAADISYLEGALDIAYGPGAAWRILDKTCGAMAQGADRLERGRAYAEYDRTVLSPGKTRSLTVVPGCAHEVTCVFPSEAARAALLGTTR